jgi:hypothetical protein
MVGAHWAGKLRCQASGRDSLYASEAGKARRGPFPDRVCGERARGGRGSLELCHVVAVMFQGGRG